MAVYGIDLGTTYSCIARLDDQGRPEVLPNAAGTLTTPSVVYYPRDRAVVVGKAARNAALVDPQRVVQLVKRHMGTPWTVEIDGRRLTPQDVSAEIIRYLAESVARAGETVEDVVITVPAYFGLAERRATEQAGNRAGLKVLALVPEPVAAALCYGAIGEGRRSILVFDLGGGTFDTTAVTTSAEQISVVCTGGDNHLGGADWDALLADHLLDRFQEAHPELDAGGNEQFCQELARKAEEHKIDLSDADSVTAVLSHAGVMMPIEVTRKDFDELTAPKLGQVMDITRRTVEIAARRGVDHFDEVLLVGGSSRMPAIDDALRSRFGFAPKQHDPDRAVARGAALFAAHEVRSRPGHAADPVPVVTTVLPRAFGIRVFDRTDPTGRRKVVDHILHANDRLPITAEPRLYATWDDNQTDIAIDVWEQAGQVEDRALSSNRHIGRGVIRGFPPLPRGSLLTVQFAIDRIGRLTVSAEDLTHHQRLRFDVEFSIDGTPPRDPR